MNLNSIIFPAPTEDKTYELLRYRDEIIFVPKEDSDGKLSHIPCLVQHTKRKLESNKFLFYFHGNAEDIFNSTTNLEYLRNSLPYHTVAIEYPGYSLYYKEKSAEAIEQDSLVVFDFFVEKLGVNEKDIVVCGRSIGSGPAVYLAAKRNPGALILISPFKSIRETASSIVGFLKYIIAERFRNIDLISECTCPLLLIHGQRDTLIPFTQSIELSQKTSGPYELILPEDMDHNEFNIYEDFVEPIVNFLKRHNLLSITSSQKIEIDKCFFEIPDYILNPTITQSKDYTSKFLRKLLKI